MSTPDLTTTSYAILGLLNLRSWTTYELAQQMERGMRWFWPRAASRIYEEPKRLVARGLATAAAEPHGRRARTVYSITPAGRRALEDWLAVPGNGPNLEFEAMLKVFFAEQGRSADLAANIEGIREWAERLTAENIAFARMYLDTGGPFPERLATIILVGRFLTDLADMVEGWADWAAEVVASWPDDPSAADPAIEVLEAVAARRMPAAQVAVRPEADHAPARPPGSGRGRGGR